MSFVSDSQSFLPISLIWLGIFRPCLCQQEDNVTDDMDLSSYSFDYDGLPHLCDKVYNHQFRLWFMSTFFSIISFAGLTGNLLLILTVIYFNRLRTMTDVYLLNLSFADLLFALSLPFWAANCLTKWMLGVFLCKIMHTIYKLTFCSSMLLLCLISGDRYLAIVMAVSAHRPRFHTVFLSKVSSAIVWIIALIISIPEMKYTTVTRDTCTHFSSTSDPLHIGIQTSQIVVAFVLPLLVMSFCYSKIVQTLSRARNLERNKAFKVIVVVVTVFVVCQLPYNVVLFWTTLVIAYGGTTDCRYENNLLYATDVTQCVAFLRCCLNPLVYAFIGIKFRHDLLRLLKTLGCLSQEMFFNYTCRSSPGLDTDTTTTLAPLDSTVATPTQIPPVRNTVCLT